MKHLGALSLVVGSLILLTIRSGEDFLPEILPTQDGMGPPGLAWEILKLDRVRFWVIWSSKNDPICEDSISSLSEPFWITQDWMVPNPRISIGFFQRCLCPTPGGVECISPLENWEKTNKNLIDRSIRRGMEWFIFTIVYNKYSC